MRTPPQNFVKPSSNPGYQRASGSPDCSKRKTPPSGQREYAQWSVNGMTFRSKRKSGQVKEQIYPGNRCEVPPRHQHSHLLLQRNGASCQEPPANTPQRYWHSGHRALELEVGLGKLNSSEKRREQLQTLVDQVTVIPFGEEEAKCAAEVRTSLEKLGTPIGPIDNLIAGTAIAAKTILVTHNSKEFTRIEGLETVCLLYTSPSPRD